MCTLPGNFLVFSRSRLMQLFGDSFEAEDFYKSLEKRRFFL